MNYVPFVYLLTFKPTGQFYYGSRTASGCQTSDLWTTYFTSSRIVEKLIEEHGKDTFDFEIRKTFISKTETLEWETRFLTKVDAKRNPRFLNRSNGGKNFGVVVMTQEHKDKIGRAQVGKIVSEETKRKQSIATRNASEQTKLKRQNSHKNRPPMSEETKRKISVSSTGKLHSLETKRIISIANKDRRPTEECRRLSILANTGRVVSEETKRKMSVSAKNISAETRQRMSSSGKGRPKSKETKQKMSLAVAARWERTRLLNSAKKMLLEANQQPMA